MSETQTPTPSDVAAATAKTDEPPAQSETPNPAETVEFWKHKAREQEKRAKENAEAAKRLTEIEEAQKSEAQKQAEALQRAEQQLAAERSARLRAEVAAAKGVPADLLVGGTQEELEASADALIAFKGEPSGPVVPGQGKTPDAPAPENADDWLRGLARQ